MFYVVCYVLCFQNESNPVSYLIICPICLDLVYCAVTLLAIKRGLRSPPLVGRSE